MDIYELLNKKSPDSLSLEIKDKFKECRKNKRVTQKELSKKSGVTYGTIRQFEQKGKISLESLLKLADALDMLSDFDLLFNPENHRDFRRLVDEHPRYK